MNLIVHHLQFTLEAQTFVHLGPQAGGQIRGALWAALRQFACTDPAVRGDPQHSQHCPMCRLMALETAKSARGVNPPRPFAVRPPLTTSVTEDRAFYSGDTFTIGVNLFGDAADLFPYVCQAFHRMGKIGVGYGRGRFLVQTIRAITPFNDQALDLLDDQRIVAAPGLPVNHEQIRMAAGALPDHAITLHFLTPAQIKHRGQLVDHPHFEALIARLLERCQALEQHYTDQSEDRQVWRARHLALTEQAQDIRLVEDQTCWVSVQSGSRRTRSRNTIGGIVGRATFKGDLTPFREWLLWGQSLHVGKNIVKGDGWYRVELADLE
jgi:hypothetical protein